MNYVRYKRWLKVWCNRQDPPVPIPKGFNPNNNKFGKPAHELVKRAQRRARIPVSGQFDSRTIWLIAPIHERAVIVAQKELGNHEWPANSNWGDDVKKYLASAGITFPTAWCAAFVTYCYKKAGYKGALPKQLAWVPAWVTWAKAKGKTVPLRHARRGDLICVEWGDGDPTADHIGIITAKHLLSSEYSTIEGNVGNGGRVERRKRYFYQTATVIRL